MEAFLNLQHPGALSHLELKSQQGVYFIQYLTKCNQAELLCDD